MLLECDFARLYGNQIALLINSGNKEPYFKADWWIRNDGMAVTSLINHSRRGALESNIYKQAGYAVDNVNVVDMYWNLQTQGTDICMAQQHLVGQGLLIIEAWRSRSNTPHSLGLLWTSDHRDLCLKKTQHSKETDIRAPGGIRTRNPSKRAPQIHAQGTEYYRKLK